MYAGLAEAARRSTTNIRTKQRGRERADTHTKGEAENYLCTAIVDADGEGIAGSLAHVSSGWEGRQVGG